MDFLKGCARLVFTPVVHLSTPHAHKTQAPVPGDPGGVWWTLTLASLQTFRASKLLANNTVDPSTTRLLNLQVHLNTGLFFFKFQ